MKSLGWVIILIVTLNIITSMWNYFDGDIDKSILHLVVAIFVIVANKE